jgi:uncharacterized protein
MDVLAAVGIGFAAGVIAGLLGVGGGLLFVPALTLALGLGHLEAEATSLLAIVPVAVVGTSRQRAYGNVRMRDAVALGLLATGGSVGGVAIANALPEDALRIGFAALILLTAAQLARRGLASRPPSPAG